MTQLFTIENDKIVINKLALSDTEGNVNHTGQLSVTGDVAVTGAITVDTLTVKTLITEAGDPADVGNWTVNAEEELVGKGLSWTHGNGSISLVYRDGNRLWSNGDIDLDISRSYKIDNVEVLSVNSLGSQVTKSNLREVGPLKKLNVIGDSILGEFAFFNSNFSRLGLNTENPNSALAILDNGVEIVLGAPADEVAQIGTYTNHDLEIITDDTARITIKNSGLIVIGNEATKTADVTIYGTLTVENIISDTRVDRISPLEFKATRDSAIFGKGLIWTGTGSPRQLVMMAGPDRLWTSESFDLAVDQSYYINNQPVLSQHRLGDLVTTSKLTSVGVLENLEVQGEVKFNGDVNVLSGTAQLKNAVFNDGVNWLNISSSRVNSSGTISINVTEDEVFYADQNEIAIGNKNNTRRAVKLFGPVSVNTNNPDPDVDFTVKGNVSFAGKKFITGTSAPSEGTFSKGNICWNDEPASDNYIGWVCVQEGAPGVWLPFGAINRQ
ncbi:hypothetical protein UFOVP181_229 [uncultured Caudovirales phage]|uniref:Uncharacterized protein n=1 Tax=uncultured Caudovirales phage TaxID=2100421 RepID=A0A6J5L1R9_9CAUD|nr:hypothetical protein UFOVP57_410 [uncultured Caudovirales phage]CAB5208879.1 hypothetical protein UFOVP181_229 [uncultured Caudovirales phage]